jgi:hypothetical protein
LVQQRPKESGLICPGVKKAASSEAAFLWPQAGLRCAFCEQN